MEERTKQNIARYISLLLAMILIVCGVLLVTVFILSEVMRLEHKDITTVSAWPNALIITFGFFVILVGMVGLVGFYKEHLQIMKVFCMVVTVIIVVEYATGIVCFICSEMTAEKLAKDIDFSIKDYEVDDEITGQIDSLQTKLKCCGNKNILDWTSHENYSCVNGTVGSPCPTPSSCCSSDTDKDQCSFHLVGIQEQDMMVVYQGNTYANGCGAAFQQWVGNSVDVFGLASLVVIVPQVMCALVLNWLIQYIQFKNNLYTAPVNA